MSNGNAIDMLLKDFDSQIDCIDVMVIIRLIVSKILLSYKRLIHFTLYLHFISDEICTSF